MTNCTLEYQRCVSDVSEILTDHGTCYCMDIRHRSALANLCGPRRHSSTSSYGGILWIMCLVQEGKPSTRRTNNCSPGRWRPRTCRADPGCRPRYHRPDHHLDVGLPNIAQRSSRRRAGSLDSGSCVVCLSMTAKWELASQALKAHSTANISLRNSAIVVACVFFLSSADVDSPSLPRLVPGVCPTASLNDPVPNPRCQKSDEPPPGGGGSHEGLEHRFTLLPKLYNGLTIADRAGNFLAEISLISRARVHQTSGAYSTPIALHQNTVPHPLAFEYSPCQRKRFVFCFKQPTPPWQGKTKS